MSATWKTNKSQHRLTANTRSYVHRLADVHSGSFAPALASLIFDSPCRFTTANAPANRQCPYPRSLSVCNA